jgi:MFS family permease
MHLHHQEIGCLIGALSNLWVGDRLGRRRTIVLGGCIMIIGAILQTTSYGYAQLVVARIVTGIGNGLNVGISLFLICPPFLSRALLGRPLQYLAIMQNSPQQRNAAH